MLLPNRFLGTIPIAIGKFILAATSCSLILQPSLSPAPQLPNSQVLQEAVEAVVPVGARRWCCALPTGGSSPLFYALIPRSHQGIRLMSVVLHSAAD